MLMTLFDQFEPPAPPERVRQRREPFGNHLKYTRYPGKGRKEQVRLWSSTHGSINCGLYERELAAVVRRKLIPETARHPATPVGVWHALCAVLEPLRRQGADVPDVLPKYVERRPGGGFLAFVRKGGREIECPGPFDTPEAAYEAMAARLEREFPPAPPSKRTRAEQANAARVAKTRRMVALADFMAS